MAEDCTTHYIYLLGASLQVGNQILSLILLLDTSEHHLSTGNVLLGVLQVGEQSLVIPDNALVDVGLRVRVTRGRTSLATDQAHQVGALLVGLTSSHGVALSTLGLENLSTLLNVSHFDTVLIIAQ